MIYSAAYKVVISVYSSWSIVHSHLLTVNLLTDNNNENSNYPNQQSHYNRFLIKSSKLTIFRWN